MAGCREKQDVLKVTYRLESYLVKVITAICVCVLVSVFLHISVCLPPKYNNAAISSRGRVQ